MVTIQVNKATTLIWTSSLTLLISSLTPGARNGAFSPHLADWELLVPTGSC